MNKVILIGRLTRDVDLRSMPNGKPVASASIATSEKFKDQTGAIKEVVQFTNLVIFQGAETFAKYLHKGSQVAIHGKLRTSDYLDKDNRKVYKTEVIVDEFKFLDAVNNGGNGGQPQAQRSEGQAISGEVEPAEEEIRIEDIPF